MKEQLTMNKTIVTAIALVTATVAASSASAYTCKNTVERINGEIVYTYSQCGDQAPASEKMLELMSYNANNPSEDREEEVVETPVVVAPVVVEPTKLQKLTTRRDNLMTRKSNLTAKIQSMSGGAKKKALKQKRRNVNKKINNVTNKINKINGGGNVITAPKS